MAASDGCEMGVPVGTWRWMAKPAAILESNRGELAFLITIK